MPNQRKASLKHHGAWLEDSTFEGLQALAAKLGMNFTGLLTALGDGDVRLERSKSGELVLSVKNENGKEKR